MYEYLEPRADYYAEIVLHNSGYEEYVEYISRDSLKTMIAEAYKQGYRDANDLVRCNRTCNQRILNIPEIVERMQIQHILNKLNDDERL